jgi:glycosyltransferase involved in cell wall biosynthesis
VSTARCRIGVDARELLGRPTGVGRYLAELLARWTRSPEYAWSRLVLYSPAALSLPWLGAGGALAQSRVVPGGTGTRWEQLDLPRAARRDALDVFFSPAYTAPLGLRVPLVVAMHDVSFAAHPEWFRWREGLRRRWLARATVARAAGVLTLTGFSRQEIVDLLGADARRVRVVAPAVDTHPALRTTGSGDKAIGDGARVLYVGSILNRRHVPDMIRAFDRLTRAVPGARLDIVGENRTHPREDLDTLVRSLDLEALVTLRDYVDEATLEGLYASARAFVFLSEYEGFGLTPLEAMARGVPALVLDTPPAREACGDAAVYVARPDDHTAIAFELRRLAEDDGWHAVRSRAGREAAARFSWDRTARETFAVLTACAQGTGGK